MFSGDTGKTIFKCKRFSSFLSYVNHFCLKLFSLFLRKVRGAEGSCVYWSGTAQLIKQSLHREAPLIYYITQKNSSTLALLRVVADTGLGGEGNHPLSIKRQHFFKFPEKFD